MTKTVTAEDLENYKDPIQDALDARGITLDYLIDKLHEELNANEIRHFAHKGMVVESKADIDYEVRQRARIDAHKLRGDYPPEEHRLTGDIVSRPPEEVEELRQLAKELAKAMRAKAK